MLINKITAFNFASYKALEFKMTHNGLCLIQGPTGSGKSTLCDLVPWALFGRTSKNGAVDEVLSWPGTEVCKVICEIGEVEIVRTRGPKAKDNDLYIAERKWQGVIKRGKDLNDTQKKINDLIGMDYDLYLSGSYFHEFSQTAQFFITTAKNRRAICEQIVDLSLAKKLQINLAADKKSVKFDLTTTEGELAQIKTHIQYVENNLQREERAAKVWDNKHVAKVAELNEKYENFEQDKADKLKILNTKVNENLARREQAEVDLLEKIQELKNTLKPKEFYNQWSQRIERLKANHKSETCSECGGDKKHKLLTTIAEDEKTFYKESTEARLQHNKLESYKDKLTEIREEVDPLVQQAVDTKNQKNTYGEQLDQVIQETSPHTEALAKYKEDLTMSNARFEAVALHNLKLKQKLTDLELLSDIIENFRGEVVKNTTLSVEDKANLLLTGYFDGEIRINLIIEDADKVEVNIFKDGNQCSYSQLSKGQRQMLKFTFGLAVMQAVSNHNGVKFEQVWIDEALDGLDDYFKTKAYTLLKSLENEYNSIYVVEHSETLKALFANSISVRLTEDGSIIEKS